MSLLSLGLLRLFFNYEPAIYLTSAWSRRMSCPKTGESPPALNPKSLTFWRRRRRRRRRRCRRRRCRRRWWRWFTSTLRNLSLTLERNINTKDLSSSSSFFSGSRLFFASGSAFEGLVFTIPAYAIMVPKRLAVVHHWTCGCKGYGFVSL